LKVAGSTSCPPFGENATAATFVLLVYEQEEFVVEAVRAALAQDHSPLQIIISDDASTDKSVELIEHELKSYGGNADIVLNVNARNLGLGGHVNRVMELATGELIVAAAGDDVSLPDRVSVNVAGWEAAGKKPDSIVSATIEIDERGHEHGIFDFPIPTQIDKLSWLIENSFPVLGAAHAWTRRVFDHFGPLLPRITNEDAAITFRSALMGGIYKIHRPLVKYRRANQGLSHSGEGLNFEQKVFVRVAEVEERLVWLYRQRLHDLKAVGLDLEYGDCVRHKILEHSFAVSLAKRESISGGDVVKLVAQGTDPVWMAKNIARYKLPMLYKKWLQAKGLI